MVTDDLSKPPAILSKLPAMGACNTSARMEESASIKIVMPGQELMTPHQADDGYKITYL